MSTEVQRKKREKKFLMICISVLVGAGLLVSIGVYLKKSWAEPKHDPKLDHAANFISKKLKLLDPANKDKMWYNSPYGLNAYVYFVLEGKDKNEKKLNVNKNVLEIARELKRLDIKLNIVTLYGYANAADNKANPSLKIFLGPTAIRHLAEKDAIGAAEADKYFLDFEWKKAIP